MNIVFLPGDIHILEPQNILGQTEDYNINMFCFTPKNVELNSRMEKMVGCPGVRIICPNGEISTCKLLFQGTVSYSAGRGLVRNKYQHHLKLACFCHDIDKKCVHLVVNNNHTLTDALKFCIKVTILLSSTSTSGQLTIDCCICFHLVIHYLPSSAFNLRI